MRLSRNETTPQYLTIPVAHQYGREASEVTESMLTPQGDDEGILPKSGATLCVKSWPVRTLGNPMLLANEVTVYFSRRQPRRDRA